MAPPPWHSDGRQAWRRPSPSCQCETPQKVSRRALVQGSTWRRPLVAACSRLRCHDVRHAARRSMRSQVTLSNRLPRQDRRDHAPCRLAPERARSAARSSRKTQQSGGGGAHSDRMSHSSRPALHELRNLSVPCEAHQGSSSLIGRLGGARRGAKEVKVALSHTKVRQIADSDARALNQPCFATGLAALCQLRYLGRGTHD